MLREERDGTVSIKLYGDPEAIRAKGDEEWTYIHTLSRTSFEQLKSEIIGMSLQKMVREPA